MRWSIKMSDRCLIISTEVQQAEVNSYISEKSNHITPKCTWHNHFCLVLSESPRRHQEITLGFQVQLIILNTEVTWDICQFYYTQWNFTERQVFGWMHQLDEQEILKDTKLAIIAHGFLQMSLKKAVWLSRFSCSFTPEFLWYFPNHPTSLNCISALLLLFLFTKSAWHELNQLN